ISYWMKKDEAKTMSLPRNIGGEYRRNGYVVPCNFPSITKSIIQRDAVMPEDGTNDTIGSNGQTKNSSIDCREWRQIIEQQRLPSPGDPESRNRIDADSKFQFRPNKDTGIHHRLNKKIARYSLQSEPTQIKKFDSGIENVSSADQFLVPKNLSENNRSIASNSSKAYESDESNNRKINNKLPSSTDEPLLSVSGKHRCSHCSMELGKFFVVFS
ncbi:unnamed protein product, partial [Onchocerca ochengi]|uniref:Nuclear receptor domain-containing protein n=1 Tax=Onchocerca ochengi TaxID=42157 RepID=A0A182EQP3_ONCOC